MADSIVTPIPKMKNTKYGAVLSWNWDSRPAVIGPIAQPIPNVVSYAPIIVPEISFRVLLRMISRVNGKKILNPNPIINKAIANSSIVSAPNDKINPNAIDNVAAIKVWLVLLASFPATTSVMILETPKIKYKISICVPDIELSSKNAG